MSLSLTFHFVQGVPKLVTQKCAVITSELEVTNRSGTIQKLCLVLKFSFKPPDGIPLVQRCLEILPVIMDWTWWNDSLATMIAWFNTPGLFCVGIHYRQSFCSTSSCKVGRTTGTDNRISVTFEAGMIHRLWDEISYRWDICRVTWGNHIEQLWISVDKN